MSQIYSIRLEHVCRRQDGSREGICYEPGIRRERKGLFLLCAKCGRPFQRSRKASGRHDTDEDQSEGKSSPLLQRHIIEHCSPARGDDQGFRHLRTGHGDTLIVDGWGKTNSKAEVQTLDQVCCRNTLDAEIQKRSEAGLCIGCGKQPCECKHPVRKP